MFNVSHVHRRILHSALQEPPSQGMFDASSATSQWDDDAPRAETKAFRFQPPTDQNHIKWELDYVTPNGCPCLTIQNVFSDLKLEQPGATNLYQVILAKCLLIPKHWSRGHVYNLWRGHVFTIPKRAQSQNCQVLLINIIVFNNVCQPVPFTLTSSWKNRILIPEHSQWNLLTRVSMEVSNYLVSWFITYLQDLQPTYKGVTFTKYHGHPSIFVGNIFGWNFCPWCERNQAHSVQYFFCTRWMFG